MIASQRKELEDIGGKNLLRVVDIRECPSCSVLVICVIPHVIEQEKLT